MATSVAKNEQPSLNGIIPEPQTKRLTDLPTELLEHILCFPVLKHGDICSVSCGCKRLHDVCHGRGKVWEHQYKLRWSSLFCGIWCGSLVSGVFWFCEACGKQSYCCCLFCFKGPEAPQCRIGLVYSQQKCFSADAPNLFWKPLLWRQIRSAIKLLRRFFYTQNLYIMFV